MTARKKPEDLKKNGRKTKYKPEYDYQAYRLCLMLNVDDKKIADYFGISVSTLNKWKTDYPSFSASIKDGKENSDIEMVETLRDRAKGFEKEEELVFCHRGEIVRTKIKKYYPPEPKCLELWLGNRQRWYRNKTEAPPTNTDPVVNNIINAKTPDHDRNELD